MLGIYVRLLTVLTTINTVISEKYEINVWKYERGMVPVEKNEIIELPGRSCYLIIQKERGAKADDWNLYYFIPKNAEPYNIIETAVFAISVNYQLNSRTRISREVEGHESASFKRLFPNLAFGRNDLYETMAIENFDPWNRKRAFIIREERRPHMTVVPRMTEVPIQLWYIFETTPQHSYCFVCNLDNVYVYCSNYASHIEKNSSAELAKVLLKRRSKKSTEIVMIALPRELAKRGELTFNEFVEKLQEATSETIPGHDIPVDNMPLYFTLEEERRIFLQTTLESDGTETFNIDVSRFLYEDRTDKSRTNPIKFMNQLSSHGCYTIDSRSNLGVLVWIGRFCKLDKLKEATKNAESILKEEYERWIDNGIPVTYINEEEITPVLMKLDNIGQIMSLSIDRVVARVLKKYVENQ